MPTAFAPRFRAVSVPGAHLPRLRAQVQTLTLARVVRRAVYEFPAPARLAVGDAMRRAAGRIPVLVAEACHRRARNERARLLERTWESLREVEGALAESVSAGLLSAERGAEIARHCRWTGAVLDALLWAPMR